MIAFPKGPNLSLPWNQPNLFVPCTMCLPFAMQCSCSTDSSNAVLRSELLSRLPRNCPSNLA